MESFLNLYLHFKQLPKGERIINPNDLVFVCTLNIFILEHIPFQTDRVYITRRSLKHIAEKGNDLFIGFILEICNDPEEIRRGKIPNRYLLSKKIVILGNRPHVLCLEVIEGSPMTIVTIFSSDEKYLSNFDLLWRTGVS